MAKKENDEIKIIENQEPERKTRSEAKSRTLSGTQSEAGSKTKRDILSEEISENRDETLSGTQSEAGSKTKRDILSEERSETRDETSSETRDETRSENRSKIRIGMNRPGLNREELREQDNENRRRMSRGPGGLSTGRRPNYSMVRLRQTAINRLKTFKSGSDSINDTIEELLNYYEANNQFLHTKLERFEEDLIEGGRVRYFFPTGDDVEESELTITKLVRFFQGSFENVTFVKYEYTTGEGIIGAPTYVITFYTEKRGIRRPFFMMMASVDNIYGLVPHDPEEKNMAKGEAFFGWKPLFIASESEFRPERYVVNNYRKNFDQYPPSDMEEFIKDEIKLSYDLSRGQVF